MRLLAVAALLSLPWFPAGYALPRLVLLSFGGLLCLGVTERATSYDRPLAWLWLVLLASTIYSVDPYLSVVGRYNDWAHGLVGLAVISTFLLAGTARKDIDLTLFARLGLVLALGAVAERAVTGVRAIGPSGDPVVLGSLLALLTPIVLFRYPRWVLLMAAGLWATGSRGAWLGALVGCLLR